MKGRASRAVYMRLQPSLLSPPSDPEEREKKKGAKKKKGSKKKLHPLAISSSTLTFLEQATAFKFSSQAGHATGTGPATDASTGQKQFHRGALSCASVHRRDQSI